MRLISFILIFIGLVGIVNPTLFIAEGSGGGRWVFVVIFLLGMLKIWSIIKKNETA
ncbi:hypothetical protein MNL09_02105 [Bartonella krasnovii]|uniref:hypothetical protein n=1 Tax=Bartonella krasnovii TaxID=2267275 RepID=UPI001F4CFBBF|nr:hypothetical protein [Bartonella krasnovii]UNF40994.1 hypothetical protein MNL09_02105 [Bartonella krasnovii]UNF52511.1 hypothetical protein MNL02_02125 [Bartonella krasnovii]